FFATPTAIFASMSPPDEDPHVVLLRVRPGDDDLGKLTALYEARDRVMRGETDADAGLRAIAAVLAGPPTPGLALPVPAWSLASAARAAFLGGGGAECAVAGAIGLLVAAFGWFAHKRPRLHRTFEALACAIAAFAAQAAARWIPLDRGTAIVASIVPL